LTQIFTDENRLIYAVILLFLSVGIFWKVKTDLKKKYKCLRCYGTKPKGEKDTLCIKMLQSDLRKKHCLHCDVMVKGNICYNKETKMNDKKPEHMFPRLTEAEREMWDGEEILEAFHIRSMLQCKDCHKKCREHKHEAKNGKRDHKHCADDFYIHVRCYADYKSTWDGRNWFEKNILGLIPIKKFGWRMMTPEQIEEKKKKDAEKAARGQGTDTEETTTAFTEEGGDFEDNFYPMQTVQDPESIEMTHKISKTEENDDHFHSMN
jgi:hypothetical protein